MENNKKFEMRYKKLFVEAILRSIILSLAIGFCAVFVIGIVLWFIGNQSIPLVLAYLGATLLAVTLISTPIVYFAKFRPTIIKNARRIDSLGLEERIVTMLDYQNDDSLMATIQRNDALNALNKFDEKSIKFEFTKKSIRSLIICASVGIVMSVVAVLSAAGLLFSGSQLLDKALEEPPVYIPVSYIVDEGGYIDGESEQLILYGESAEAVVAIPDEGYSFEGWDDGYSKPSRHDEKIDHPLVLVAIFVPIDEEGDEDEDGDGDAGGEKPSEQEGQGDDGEGEQQGDQEGESDDEQQGEGHGKYNKSNQIIDGETYYREFLEEYKETIIDLLKKKAEELTEEEKALIEAYINIV